MDTITRLRRAVAISSDMQLRSDSPAGRQKPRSVRMAGGITLSIRSSRSFASTVASMSARSLSRGPMWRRM